MANYEMKDIKYCPRSFERSGTKSEPQKISLNSIPGYRSTSKYLISRIVCITEVSSPRLNNSDILAYDICLSNDVNYNILRAQNVLTYEV